MNYNELLFNQDKILSFYPELARILNKYEEITVAKENEKSDKKKRCEHNGLNKAIFINQIHYWIELNKKTNKNFRDGYYWTYNTYSGWVETDFCYWSSDTIKRTVNALEEIGVVVSTSKYNKFKIDKTKWYRIDYDRLQEIIDNVSEYESASCTIEEGNLHRTIPEINTEKKHFINRSETVATDFDDEILEKAKEYTDNETILDGINYFLKTFKQRMNKSHPNITYRSLDNVIGNIEELLINVDDIEDFENSNGFRLMVDNYFDTEYTEDVDYKIQHFASGKVLEYQARNCGYITGWMD